MTDVSVVVGVILIVAAVAGVVVIIADLSEDNFR